MDRSALLFDFKLPPPSPRLAGSESGEDGGMFLDMIIVGAGFRPDSSKKFTNRVDALFSGIAITVVCDVAAGRGPVWRSPEAVPSGLHSLDPFGLTAQSNAWLAMKVSFLLQAT